MLAVEALDRKRRSNAAAHVLPTFYHVYESRQLRSVKVARLTMTTMRTLDYCAR